MKTRRGRRPAKAVAAAAPLSPADATNSATTNSTLPPTASSATVRKSPKKEAPTASTKGSLNGTESDSSSSSSLSSSSSSSSDSNAAPNDFKQPDMSAVAAASPAKMSNKRSHASGGTSSGGSLNSSPSKRKRMDDASGGGGGDDLAGSSTVSSNDALNGTVSVYCQIKDILAKHYFNVVERLQLNFQPSCMSNLEYCSEHHTKNGNHPHEIDDYLVKDARNLIIEDRPQDFLKFVSKLSIHNDFPGKIIILSLLELILTVNKPNHEHYTTSSIIQTTNYLFENIVNNFPPCWNDVRDSYKKLLHQKLHIVLERKKYDVNTGIVKVVLTMLETVLQEEDDSLESQAESEFDSPMDFRAWEKVNRQRYLFDSLQRDDKIERIFLVLHLLVKLMESDLAIWIIRHPVHTNTTMSKPKRMPLIGYLLWPAEECGQINPLIKKILNLFVISISIGMPDDKIDVLARFVNLVANAINLCEIQPKTATGIKYPNIQSYTDIFALELKKTIEKVQTCNVDLILAVIDHIKAPFIQIIAIDQLLMKFNRDVGKPSMKKLYQNFQKKRWTECDEEGSRKIFTYIPADPLTSPRYPVYRPLTQKPKLSDIYQTDYLHLLLSSFRAYQVLYQVDAVVKSQIANSGGGGGNAGENSVDDRGKLMKKMENQKQTKFNFVEMEKDIAKLEDIAERTARLDRIFYGTVDASAIDILVDSDTVVRYRDDMKHFLLLRDMIESYFQDYGEIFGKWRAAFRDVVVA